MNKANVIALADFVESAKFKFDMASAVAFPSCGTAGCLGGHAAVLWIGAVGYYRSAGMIAWSVSRVGQHLDLALWVVRDLCYPNSWADRTPLNYSDVTRAQAVATLRRLAEIGKVEWRRE